jgi:polyisoprenoid-binding protein YceI
MFALIAIFVVGGQLTPYTLAAGSAISIDGDSNIHRWSCNAPSIEATLGVDRSAPELTNSVTVRIEVARIDCGHGSMNSRLRDALHAKQDPYITYRLVSIVRLPGSGIQLRATGEVTIAGRTRTVTFDVSAVEDANGGVRATGSLPLKMSDYGVKPPSAVLLFKTYDDITVKFDLRAVPQPASLAKPAASGGP